MEESILKFQKKRETQHFLFIGKFEKFEFYG
jgi:hypothetical protein